MPPKLISKGAKKAGKAKAARTGNLCDIVSESCVCDQLVSDLVSNISVKIFLFAKVNDRIEQIYRHWVTLFTPSLGCYTHRQGITKHQSCTAHCIELFLGILLR